MTTPDPFRALETPAYRELMGAPPLPAWRRIAGALLPLAAQTLYLAALMWALWPRR